MEAFVAARVLHVLGVVLWIGGVAMVTMVILPSLRRMEGANKMELFERLEGRFSFWAKIWVLVTGLSGFYMLHVLKAWERLIDFSFWWIQLMVLVWLIFVSILFILEPFVIKQKFKKLTSEKALSLIYKGHWILLILSLAAVAAGVAGSHGAL